MDYYGFSKQIESIEFHSEPDNTRYAKNEICDWPNLLLQNTISSIILDH